ncbi:UNVERIFIED_CONTAM: hypothetical protein RMT77_014458 [Armadillidium vulgare]
MMIFGRIIIYICLLNVCLSLPQFRPRNLQDSDTDDSGFPLRSKPGCITRCTMQAGYVRNRCTYICNSREISEIMENI